MMAFLERSGVADAEGAAMDLFAMTRGIVVVALLSGQCEANAARKRTRRAVMGYIRLGDNAA